MTTVDRIEAVLSRSWTASSVAVDYVGRHRAFGTAELTVRRLLYVARHLARPRVRRTR